MFFYIISSSLKEMMEGEVYKMMHEKRNKYYATANYVEGSDLGGLVKTIIYRTVSNETIKSKGTV